MKASIVLALAVAALVAADTLTGSVSSSGGTSTLTVGKPPVTEEAVATSFGIRSIVDGVESITLTYDFKCVNSGSNYVTLVARDSDDASFIEIVGLDDMTVNIEALVRNTPEQNKPGHGDYSGSTSTEVLVGNTLNIGNTVAAKFNKGGGGRPEDWRAATGNPYIYFRSDNGWDCSCVREDGKDVWCDPYEEDEVVKVNGAKFDDICCKFKNKHTMGNGPTGSNGEPPRVRLPGDIYAGRCKQYLDEFTQDLTPAFSIVCKAEGLDAQKSLQTYPTCGSVKHNIGLGVGMNIVEHHKVFASQVGPHKFIGCNTDGSNCLTGAGPHETYTEDTCLNTPPLGAALIDKSAGIVQTDQPLDGECSNDIFSRREGNSTARNPGDYTACGVGGNPCLVEFSCSINDESCFSNDVLSVGVEVLDALPCIEDPERKCPDNYGCRCSQVRAQTKQLVEVPC